MTTTEATSIEMNVRYRKKLIFFDDWEIEPRNANSRSCLRGNSIHVPTGSGPHEIVFHFDPGGHSLKWAAADQIWVQEGRCPTSPAHDDQITNNGLDPAGRTLTITDNPTRRGKFYYSLNFEKRNGKPKRWDPIIIHD